MPQQQPPYFPSVTVSPRPQCFNFCPTSIFFSVFAVFFKQRSSTGTTGKSISKTRTSDNAFVTHTKTAQALKRRIFQLLGIEEYHESWADGLQVGGTCFGYIFC